MLSREHFLWTEKYRPKTVEDCILPDNIKQIFKGIVSSKTVPNLLLSGGPGQGKTTLAKALCSELDLDFLLINGSDERGIDVLRTKVKTFASSVSLFHKKKVIIIDEADYLTQEAQAAMRGVIEEFSINCTFIFTVNFQNKILDAIHSRCSTIEFKVKKEDKEKLIKSFYLRIVSILESEKVLYNQEVVGEILIKYFPDYRKILNELQKYSKINGEINEGILAQNYDIDLSALFKSLKEKNYTKMREWAVNHLDNDSSLVYRKIYDGLKGKMQSDSIPLAVIHIADYQDKHSSNPEITLVACLTKLMVDCQWL